MFLQDCNGKVQSVLRSVWSLSKPRSPLSDNSSTLIQDGNESATVNPDSSKVKKGKLSHSFKND